MLFDTTVHNYIQIVTFFQTLLYNDTSIRHASHYGINYQSFSGMLLRGTSEVCGFSIPTSIPYKSRWIMDIDPDINFSTPFSVQNGPSSAGWTWARTSCCRLLARMKKSERQMGIKGLLSQNTQPYASGLWDRLTLQWQGDQVRLLNLFQHKRLLYNTVKNFSALFITANNELKGIRCNIVQQ